MWLHEESKSGIPHLHAIVCRVDEDGNINNDHAIHLRAQRAAEKVARQRGWTTAMHIHERNIPQVSADSLGAAAGIYSIVRFYDKKCNIVLQKVTSSIKALYDRLVSDEKYDGVFITPEQALAKVKRRTLVIVVDTHRVMLCECPELLDKTSRIVVFDHHRKTSGAIENYSLTYHEAYASSTSEMVTEMLMYIKGVRLSRAEIEGLLAGITVDTKNFAFKTGIKTFEAAAFLKKNGADTISVRRLFKSSFDAYMAKTEIVRTAEIIFDNMAISELDREVENPSVLIAQAADELLSIDGIEVSYVLCNKKNTWIFNFSIKF